MQRQKSTWIMGTGTTIMLAATIAALIGAQYQQGRVPFAAFAAVLLVTVAMSRWIILDYMGFREERSTAARLLLAWPVALALAAAARVLLSGA